MGATTSVRMYAIVFFCWVKRRRNPGFVHADGATASDGSSHRSHSMATSKLVGPLEGVAEGGAEDS